MHSDRRFRRILLIAPNWLGDAVMALPAVADLRRHFADAELAVAARPALAPLFQSVDGVNAVVTLAANGGVQRPASWSRDARMLAAAGYELAVVFPNSFSSAWLTWRAGIPERWGYQSDLRGSLLTRKVRRPGGVNHQALYYQNLIRAFGIPNGPCEPRIRARAEERERAAALLAREGVVAGERLIGVAPGAAYGHAKRWPAVRFADLIARLARDAAMKCVLVGSAADRQAGRDVTEHLSRVTRRRDRSATPGNHADEPAVVGAIDLIGRTDLPLLIGVMSHCRAFVSNDSGAMHLAAACGLPVTALFGPTDERATRPLPTDGVRIRHEILTHPVWCRPCMLRECPIDHRCMTGITRAAVFEAVGRQLDTAGLDETAVSS